MADEQVEFKGTVVRCVYSSDTFKTYALDVDTKKYPFIKLNKYKNILCKIIILIVLQPLKLVIYQTLLSA